VVSGSCGETFHNWVASSQRSSEPSPLATPLAPLFNPPTRSRRAPYSAGVRPNRIADSADATRLNTSTGVLSAKSTSPGNGLCGSRATIAPIPRYGYAFQGVTTASRIGVRAVSSQRQRELRSGADCFPQKRQRRFCIIQSSLHLVIALAGGRKQQPPYEDWSMLPVMKPAAEPTRAARPASRLRQVALSANVAGAVGAVAFLLHAREHPPKLLLMIFIVWVLSPSVALSLAASVSRRWTTGTRAALYCVMILIAVGSLTVYAADALSPRRSQPAFVFVLVPPAAGLLAIVVVAGAAIVRRSGLKSTGSVQRSDIESN
jgi:hypothetical protein